MSGIEVTDASGSRVQLVDVNGFRVCNFDRKPEQQGEIIHQVRNIACRNDDVFILAPVKSGIRCYDYDGKWEDFFDLFINHELDYGSWFDYVKEWESFIKQNKRTHPVHVVYYEDLHQNNIEEVKRLGTFLGKTPSDRLARDISEKCQFQNMYVDKMYPGDIRKKIFKGDFTMYRKGKVGDWKNWFTVRQNEQFDDMYNREMVGSSLHFQYSLT